MTPKRIFVDLTLSESDEEEECITVDQGSVHKDSGTSLSDGYESDIILEPQTASENSEHEEQEEIIYEGSTLPHGKATRNRKSLRLFSERKRMFDCDEIPKRKKKKKSDLKMRKRMERKIQGILGVEHRIEAGVTGKIYNLYHVSLVGEDSCWMIDEELNNPKLIYDFFTNPENFEFATTLGKYTEDGVLFYKMLFRSKQQEKEAEFKFDVPLHILEAEGKVKRPVYEGSLKRNASIKKTLRVRVKFKHDMTDPDTKIREQINSKHPIGKTPKNGEVWTIQVVDKNDTAIDVGKLKVGIYTHGYLHVTRVEINKEFRCLGIATRAVDMLSSFMTKCNRYPTRLCLNSTKNLFMKRHLEKSQDWERKGEWSFEYKEVRVPTRNWIVGVGSGARKRWILTSKLNAQTPIPEVDFEHIQMIAV